MTSTPAGIGCPLDCTQDYPAGTPVTLKATASEGFTFDHWTGDCAGTTPTCILTMDGPRSAVAIFSGTGTYSQPTGTEAPGFPPDQEQPPPTTGGSG